VPCVVLRDETEWVEMVRPESNVLAGTEPRRILAAVNSLLSLPSRNSGETKLGKSDHSAERCIDLLEASALT
jgi:UDP-N-acetylglucosamine 2-epimerase